MSVSQQQSAITSARSSFTEEAESDESLIPTASFDLTSVAVDGGNSQPPPAKRISKSASDHFTVIWNKLSYKVQCKPWYVRLKSRCCSKAFQEQQYTKTILNKVSGSLRSGQVTAILGPSGAGKTSLLECLFQNRTSGVNGSILCDGRSDSKLKICFIPQKDYLIEHLTVREDLMFVAKLRATQTSLFVSEPTANITTDSTDIYKKLAHLGPINSGYRAQVESIAELLGLTSCLDVKISKISGGQQKRVSIAREIMSNPDILILDEPTTGLDSLSCIRTVQVLRTLSLRSVTGGRPMAIVLVVHQPQTEIFKLFDRVYFVSKDGRMIYDDSPRNVVNVLDRVSGISLPSPNYNPASFLIEIASGELGDAVIGQLNNHCESHFDSEFDVAKLKLITKRLKKVWLCSKAFIPAKQPMDCYIHPGHQFDKCDTEESTNSDQPVTLLPHQILLQPNNTPTELPQQGLSSETKQAPSSSSLLSPPVKSKGDSSKYFKSDQLRDCLSSHSISWKQSIRHTYVLTQRSWYNMIRNPSLTRTRLSFHIICPLVMALVFGSNMGSPNACPQMEKEIDIANIQQNIDEGLIAKLQEELRLSLENLSFFFMMQFAFTLNCITMTSSIYPLTMQMFKKEVVNGLYKSNPYLVAQTTVELPFEILLPTMSTLLTYHLTGQPRSYLEWRMFAMSSSMVLVCYCMHSIGLLFGSLFVNNVNVSMLLAQTVTLPLAVFSGFTIRIERLANYIRNFAAFTPYKLGFDIIVVSRYGFDVCPCDEDTKFDGRVPISGMTPQVERVLDYMFPKSNSTSDGQMLMSARELFDKLGSKFLKSQTFGLNLKSCDDVKPFAMHSFELKDSDLFRAIFYLLIIIFLTKTLTFWIVSSFPYRMRN